MYTGEVLVTIDHDKNEAAQAVIYRGKESAVGLDPVCSDILNTLLSCENSNEFMDKFRTLPHISTLTSWKKKPSARRIEYHKYIVEWEKDNAEKGKPSQLAVTQVMAEDGHHTWTDPKIGWLYGEDADFLKNLLHSENEKSLRATIMDYISKLVVIMRKNV